MSVKRQIFINNKDIDGKIANNTIFDFDYRFKEPFWSILRVGSC